MTDCSKKVVKKKRKAKKKSFRLLVFGTFSFVVIFLILGYVVSVSVDISNKYKEKNELNDKLEDLKEEEQRLTIDV